MLSALSIFEKLSSNIRLDKQDLLENVRLLPLSLGEAFDHQSSRKIREYSVDNQSFADSVAVFQLMQL